MTQFTSPILHSLLNTNTYKLHIQQTIFHHYYDIHITTKFHYRNNDLLNIYTDTIHKQIQTIQHLHLQNNKYQ